MKAEDPFVAMLDAYLSIISPSLLMFHFFSKQGGGVLGKQFQKMRRRLTVTGASQNIDGVAKPDQPETSDLKKAKKKDKVCMCSLSCSIGCAFELVTTRISHIMFVLILVHSIFCKVCCH